MKGKGKLFFMVLVLFAILTMSSVNAADNVMETNISADTSTNDNIMLNTYTNEVWISNDGSDSNSGSESDPYKTLNKSISSVGDNSCIHLKEGTYTGENNKDLVVDKNLTFIGAGADKTIIDAQKQGRIFNITGHNTITLINLTLTNGNTTDNGGVIYTDNGSVSVSDGVSFVNNSARYGGAIYVRAGSVGVIGNNVSFVNNVAGNYGDGGAICVFDGDVGVIGNNVSFVNNSATTAYGGAICVITGSVGVSGGVSFVNNSATKWYGGAIYTDDGSVSVSDGVSFVNNSAHSGSAIYIKNGNVSVSDGVSFVNNSATNYGGAIYVRAGSVGVIGNNVSFVNNSARYGGAIYTDKDNVSVSGVGVSFVNNSANNGGAINCQKYININADNVSFVNNSARYTGGAICVNDGAVGVIGNNVSFVNNVAGSSGGAIDAHMSGVGVFDGVSFVNNKGTSILRTFGNIIGNITLSNCNFINNNATQSIVSANKGFLNMSYCIFINNNGDFISCLNISNNNVDYNYWGSNNDPNFKLANVTAKTWIVLIPTINSNNVVVGDSVDLIVEFMSTTDGKTFTKLNKSMSNLPINITANIGGVNPDNIVINDNVVKTNYTANAAGVETVKINFGKTTLTNLTFNVKKSSDINISVDDIVYGEDLTVNVSVTPGATGNVTVTINNKTKTVTLRDGKVSVVFAGLGVGNYTVNVMYSGDDNYNSCSANASFVVSKVSDYNMTVSMGEIIVGEKAMITVYLPDDATGDVTIEINNQKYTQKITNGKAQFTINPLEEGTYNMTVTYDGDNNYDSLSKNLNVTVSAGKRVNLDVSDIIMFYKDGTRFVAVLTDSKNNPIANAVIYFTINGITYNRTTDSNGYASMALNLMPGVYNAGVYYKGSDNYDSASKNVTVTIKSTIGGHNIVKFYQNGTQFFATFIDTHGKVLANTNVTFNINGVFYTRKTNNDGTARLTINLRPGEYILTALNPNSTEQKGFYVTVKSLIEANDLTKYYQNASRFEAKIYNKDGSLATNTKVTFNINGVFYTRTTNDKGVVSLAINLRPGTYTITTMYGGLSMGNTVKVLSTLETKDLSMKFRDGSKFQAKTVDGQGKPLANQNITFNVNGVFYHKTTDNDGIASLSINLLSGEYIITSIWNNYQVGNKITIA